jgi:uncharacterized protein YecT (DUF1311 family)
MWLAADDVPRFDCARAFAADDILICQDQGLTRLDEQLGRIYVALRRRLAAVPSEDLRRDQRAWVHRRNAGCGLSPTMAPAESDRPALTGCFRIAYAERLALLELMLGAVQATSPTETPPPSPPPL